MNSPKALGLMCFAGGIAEGVRRSFDLAGTVEPLRLNRAREVWEQNVGKPCLSEMPTGVAGKVDLVFGHPPCHAYAGPNVTASRGATCAAYAWIPRWVGAAIAARPAAWVYDMVGGHVVAGLPEFMRDVWEPARAAEYSVTAAWGDAADLGLPQHRRRLWVVGHRVDVSVPPLPAVSRHLTAGDVIGSLRDADEEGEHSEIVYSRRYRDFLRLCIAKGWRDPMKTRQSSPELARVAAAFFTARGIGRLSFDVRMLRSDEPSPTITGMNKIFRWDAPRFITLRESSLLMTYPPWWRWLVGGDSRPVGAHFALLGKACMPDAAAEMAGWMRASLLAGRGTRGEPRLRFVHRQPPGSLPRKGWEAA